MDKKKKVTMSIMKWQNRFLEEAVQSVLEVFWNWKSPEKPGLGSVLKLLGVGAWTEMV